MHTRIIIKKSTEMKKFLLVIACVVPFYLFTQAQEQYNAQTYHQFNTNYGHIKMGPRNVSWAHFETNMPGFFFNIQNLQFCKL